MNWKQVTQARHKGGLGILWLVLRGSLPTNKFRVEHHMSFDPTCQMCGSNEESLLHTLRDCSRARRIWSLLRFANGLFLQPSDSFLWLKDNASGENGIFFVITRWFIWKAKNYEVFEDGKWED